MSVRTIQPYKYDWFDPKNRPDYSHIITEYEEPVDDFISALERSLLVSPLYTSWDTERDFVAHSNVGLFYELNTLPAVPDAMVIMDVVPIVSEDRSAKQSQTYMAWEYGKSPDIVIEVVSNLKVGELTDKVELYEKMGVPAYVVYDPFYMLSLDLITAFRRPWDDPTAPYVQSDDLMYPEIGLGLTLWEGTYHQCTDQWLRWCTSDGELLSTGEEWGVWSRGRAKARKRFENAVQERIKIEQEQAERYTQMLIAAGIDPDSQ